MSFSYLAKLWSILCKNLRKKNNFVLPTTSNVAFLPFPTTFLYIYLVYNILGFELWSPQFYYSAQKKTV